nr:hypothetical protein [Paracoccaceae bacterium]
MPYFFGMLRILANTILFVILTLLTQLGGVAWLAALRFERRLLAFLVLYAVLTTATIWVAPLFGRVALSCTKEGPLQVQSWMYCAMNRNYISPELASALTDAAAKL